MDGWCTQDDERVRTHVTELTPGRASWESLVKADWRLMLELNDTVLALDMGIHSKHVNKCLPFLSPCVGATVFT